MKSAQGGAIPDRASWGGDVPTGPAAARDRILDAARTCIVRAEGTPPSLLAVAREAGIHRSTVYEYFTGREDVLVGVFTREAHAVFLGVSGHFADDELLPALTRAIADGIGAVRRSPVMSLLLGPAGVGRTVSATSASKAWDDAIQRSLSAMMTEAVARGEVRDDVPVDELVRWVVRVALSVTAEPPPDPQQVLARFLVPALRAAQG